MVRDTPTAATAVLTDSSGTIRVSPMLLTMPLERGRLASDFTTSLPVASALLMGITSALWSTQGRLAASQKVNKAIRCRMSMGFLP